MDVNQKLLEALKAIVGPGPTGYPTFLEYYHDVDKCEEHDICAHCQAVMAARAVIKEVESGN